MSKFLNPYNFISFPPKKEGVYKRDEEKCLTGVIHYTVTTKSPLFIPNSSADAVFSQSAITEEKKTEGGEEKKSESKSCHKSYDFFSYKQLEPYKEENGNPDAPTPVIPGSEMRGVIRSVYETLTDSCMAVLNSDRLPIKRGGYTFKPGLIRKNESGYTLIEARSFRIGEKAREDELPLGFEDKKNGTLIYFKTREGRERNLPLRETLDFVFQKRENSKCNRKGYLLKWGMGERKFRYHLYSPNRRDGEEHVVREVKLNEDVLETKLVKVIESYMDQPSLDKLNSEAYQEYSSDLREFMNSSSDKPRYFPVNYSAISHGKFYLSPAVITKEISDNSVGALAGDFAPCKGAAECPACELFGHVSEDSNFSRGSKVRFSDLYVITERQENKEYFYDVCTLPALSSPKLGNVEFYLKKPENAAFWTYDYYVENGKVRVKPGQLRGRKYYWHHPEKNVLSKMPSNIQPDGLNKTVRPLREEVTFSGELYFEGISEKQLKQLVWICNSNEEKLGYKLGAAKPFGFGSVVCKVTAIEERDLYIDDGRVVYRKSDDRIAKYKCSYEEAGFSKHCKEQFYRIAKWDSVKPGTKITYPKTQEQLNEDTVDEGFLWYGKNRKVVHDARNEGEMPRGREDVRICTTLPSLEEKDVCLPYVIPEIAIVEGVSENGMKLIAKVVNSEQALSIHIKNLNIRGGKEKMLIDYPIGTKIRVTCTGEDRGYPTYHVEKIEDD